VAITYASSPGTIITSFLVTEVLGSQTQQTNNNTIVLSDNPSAVASGYGGNVGAGTLGTGDSYINRRIMIGRGATVQERIVVSEATGTGNTWILTVHEDWDTNPVATTDTVDVYYEIADVEEGGAGGGISFATRTGLWTLTRIITVGNGTDPAGLSMHGGQALECADRSANDSFLIENNGFFRFGYYSNALPISGGVVAITAASDDEPALTFASGSDTAFLDTLVWAQVATLSQISPTGATVVYDKVKLLKASQECELYGDTLINSSIAGESKTTEIIRVDSATTCSSFVMVDIQVLDSAADTSVETITLSGLVFSGVPGYVDVRQNKTWDLIDPTWDVTTYTDLTWTGTSTGNELNDKRSITATVQKADGTKLQDAVVNVYEHTQLLDLVVKTSTNVDGLATDSFIYKKHATNSVTTTYGGHALQAGKWLYLPFVAAQTATEKFSGAIVLADDNNVVETTQATALTAGSGITWNEDTNPSELFDFTSGSGTLAVGMILTFAPSGAIGTITESMSGDSTAGEIHLSTRNATAITNADTFSRTGGTAGTFSGTYTNDSKQPFSIYIDGNALSFQTIYDYIAAKTTETTLSADGELIWEWCRSAQGQALYATGTSFYTEQSNSKGIFVVNSAAGTLDYLTDDAGGTWTPPSTTNVTFTGMRDNTEVRVYATSDGSAVGGIETVTTGTTDDRSFTWSALATTDTYYKIFNVDYEEIHTKGYIVPASDASIPIQQRFDRNSSDPA
jgi:hypothetical protein